MAREYGTGIGTDADTFGLAEAHWEAGVVSRRREAGLGGTSYTTFVMPPVSSA